MTYDSLSTINATEDVTQLLVYCNHITNGLFGPTILYSFFIIVLLANYFYQLRYSAKPKFDVSFAVAAFVSAGFAIIMSLEPGLLWYGHILICVALAGVGVLWMLLHSSEY